MVWVFIVVAFLVFIFFMDKNEETNRVKQQGGFYLKYKELIDYFLEIPKIKVEKKNKTSITLSVKDRYVVTSFTIAHGFEDVSIFWNHNSITFGKHSLSWTFPESMPQLQMIQLIENELNIYQKNLMGDGF